MFLLQAPEVRELELFTSMPEPLRRRQRSAWADANRGGAVADSFLEGPVFDDAGNLYVTDIPWAASCASTHRAPGPWWPSTTASPTA